MRDLPITGGEGARAAHAADDVRAARLNGTLDAVRVMAAKLEAELRWVRKHSGIRRFHPAAMKDLARQWTNEHVRRIRRSGLFDIGWYLYSNPDVEASGENPLRHYLRAGWREGRDPNSFFSIAWYLDRNPDVRAVGAEPLYHYICHGVAEGRDPHPLFKSGWYLTQNNYVAEGGGNPLVHYISRGAIERRDPHPWFNTDWYLAQNPDVARSGLNPLFHYIVAGAAEGRDTHPWFKNDWYRAAIHSLRGDSRGAAEKVSSRPAPTGQAVPAALAQLLRMFHDESAIPVIQACNEVLKAAREIGVDVFERDPRVASLIKTCTRLADRDLGSELDATIMVSPAGDHADTLCCIYSLLSLQTKLRFEIHVADHGGAMHALVECIGGVVRNVRPGAGPGARGRVLAFLSSQTIVLPNWLDELAGTLDADPSIGLVESKRVSPGGSLRGGAHSDFGNADDACAPQNNYLRDVTTIPSTAMAMSRPLWEKFGDAAGKDLAAYARAAGLRTVYQPLSVVVHHDRSVDGNASVADARNRPRILFVDHAVPQADRDAGSRSTVQYIEMFLRAGFHVTYWPQDLYFDRPYVMALQRRGVEVMYSWPAVWPEFHLWLEQNKATLGYAYLLRPTCAVNFIDPLRNGSETKILYAGVDIHFKRLAMEVEKTGSTASSDDVQRMERLEKDVWQRSDVIYYLSDSEVDVVKSVFPNKNVQQIPIFMFDPALLERSRARVRRQDGRQSRQLLFVGGFRHSPNIDAMAWFVGEIWPRVVAAIPDARLFIAGSSPPPAIQVLASDTITVSGAISDEELTRRYTEATAAIVPLRFGAGVKGKLLEALSYGTPVVTTSIGIQGLSALATIVDVADDASEFAEVVIDILRAPGSRIDKVICGLDFLEETLTEAAALKTLSREIPELRSYLESLPRHDLHSAA